MTEARRATARVDNAQIYSAMCGAITSDDIDKAHRLRAAWADAIDGLGGTDVRTIFICCIHCIELLGPAYCEIAGATLSQRARDAVYQGRRNRMPTG